ncbi:MAG: EAL domain-containing protein [Gallionellaceae bacterium]|nr:MAG: EAL domain-containing protein [Gallionellaceae bacterium]
METKKDGYLEQVQMRLVQTRAIAQLSEAVSAAESTEQIYGVALDTLQQTIACDRAAILLFDADDVIRFKASRGISAAYIGRFTGHSPWSPSEKNAKPIMVNDTGSWGDGKALIPEFQKEGIRALAFIPLCYRGQLLGKFMVYFNQPHPFSEDEVQLVQTIAHHVGYAIGRNRAESALLASEQRLSFALEGSGDCVWDWDLGSNKVLLSKGGGAMFGFADDEVSTDMADWAARAHPEDAPRLADGLRGFFHERAEKYSSEYRVRCKDGSWKWILTRGMVVHRNAEGRVTRMIGTHTDLAERKEAEEALRHSEQRFRDVSEAAGEYIWEIDANMVYTYVSNRSADVKGYAPQELLGHTPMEFMPEEDIAAVGEIVNAAIADKVPFRLQHRDITESGAVLWEEVRGIPFYDESGKVIGLRGTGLNITERKLAEEKLQLAALVYENSAESMMVTDGDNKILGINPAFTKTTGYTLEEVLGKTPGFLNSGRQDAGFYQAMRRAIETTGRWQGEMWNRRKNGEIYVEWQSINTIFRPDGSVHRHVALFSDITQKKATEELIWRQANFDALTGLPNRRMFHDRLGQELKKAARNNLPLALMFIDLDHFKEVNDTLGHDQGDLLLIEAARRITECVRESDTVARLGGDEFTVILPALEGIDSIDRIAQNIIDRLTRSFRLGQENVFVSASIGITLYPADAGEIETLLKNADQAMYVAKNAGRNRYSYFTYALQEAAQLRMRLTNDLRKALSDNQLRVYYQPIVEMATGEIHKAEALIRWQHPERGMVSPVQFIPLAEESGLINQIGDWVFHETARQVKHWRATHTPLFQVSVNKSPVQFQQKNAGGGADWLAHLAALSLHGQSISVEITEGLLLNAEADIQDKLLALRDAGVQVAIDDFGTGYSSLAYLKKFDIDYLKIDQSFVSNLENNPDDLALCEAIIVMAHKLGLKVIAEGVETEQQRDILLRTGCDYAQGFLFSKAIPAEEFEALLARTRAERSLSAL